MRSLTAIPALLALAACSSLPGEDLEPYFRTLETGSPVEAIAAEEKLASRYDDSNQARLERSLEAAPARTLQLIGDLPTVGSAKLLLDRLPYLLEAKDPELARMAAVTSGLRRLKGATPSLLHHAEEPAALRALGRIWAQGLEAGPLPRTEEIDRLTVLALAHHQAMAGVPTLESCEAMLSIMTGAEFSGFLGTHAPTLFPARRLCEEAARRPGFDAEKGLHLHEALLGNPDVELVARILGSSPFPLREELVRGFVNDARSGQDGIRLSDLAARRLRP